MNLPASLMPLPAELSWGDGELTAGTGEVHWLAVATPRLEAAVARLPALPLGVRCSRVSDAVPALGDDESYRLTIDARGVLLEADEEWGVLRGCATLQQLLGTGGALPRVEIVDAPRFAWRGLLLDVARHFMSVDAVERTLDAMAFYKLNVLHLHLTDDQGFRFESLAYPELARAGGEGRYFSASQPGGTGR
jgi:hexosaminidase